MPDNNKFERCRHAVKNQNNLPVLDQELIEIKNRIKKIGEINV